MRAPADIDDAIVPGVVVAEVIAEAIMEVPHLLDRQLCAELIRHAEQGGWTPSGMVRPDPAGRPVLRTDTSVKARFDHRLVDDRLTGAIVGRLATHLLPAVRDGFHFSPEHFESFKLVRYPAGAGWFTAHRDNVAADCRHRRVALTVNLDAGYTGGCLNFPELGVSSRPEAGGAVLFGCGVLHEVTPVTEGVRTALITFIW